MIASASKCLRRSQGETARRAAAAPGAVPAGASLAAFDSSPRELTTLLTTTMTIVRLPDTSTYTTLELVSCLIAPSACAYGSEG